MNAIKIDVWLGFVRHRAHLAAAVVTTIRADEMRWLQLLALRTGTERARLQRVVRPALGRARLGVAAFWIRHDSTIG
jgi:hypothetical protein